VHAPVSAQVVGVLVLFFLKKCKKMHRARVVARAHCDARMKKRA
jgi:hypothetical protein